MTTEPDTRKLTSMRLPLETLHRLQAVAALTGLSQSDLVDAALQGHLANTLDRFGISDKLLAEVMETRARE